MVIGHMHAVCIKGSSASWNSMKDLVKDQVEGGASRTRLHAGLAEGEAETRMARYRCAALATGRHCWDQPSALLPINRRLDHVRNES
jgi:hypothetical protein